MKNEAPFLTLEGTQLLCSIRTARWVFSVSHQSDLNNKHTRGGPWAGAMPVHVHKLFIVEWPASIDVVEHRRWLCLQRVRCCAFFLSQLQSLPKVAYISYCWPLNYYMYGISYSEVPISPTLTASQRSAFVHGRR